jgi:membrane protease YdiL (CAAX protease family)
MHPLLRELGLVGWPPFHRDAVFWALCLAGLPVVYSIYVSDLAEPLPAPGLTLWLVVSVVVWQPVLEEILFRGFIHGQLLRASWSRTCIGGVTAANFLTSLAFAALHLVNQSPLWAASTFVPSLAFGLLRERHNSVYPAMVLHGVYNAMLMLARAA